MEALCALSNALRGALLDQQPSSTFERSYSSPPWKYFLIKVLSAWRHSLLIPYWKHQTLLETLVICWYEFVFSYGRTSQFTLLNPSPNLSVLIIRQFIRTSGHFILKNPSNCLQHSLFVLTYRVKLFVPLNKFLLYPSLIRHAQHGIYLNNIPMNTLHRRIFHVFLVEGSL